MVRTPHRCEKSGVKKGTWTPEEDIKLIAHLTTYGHPTNWRQLPKAAGLARCGKSCRLRWMNYLRPDVKRGNYTQEEDDTIRKLHNQFGNRWSMIASHLHGRSDNEIKNRWHSHLKKRFQHTSASNSNNHNALIESTEEEIVNNNSNHNNNNNATTDEYPYSNIHNTSPVSSQKSHTYDDFSSLSDIFYTPAVDLAAPFGDNSVLAIDNDDQYANFLDNVVESNMVSIGADYVWAQQDYSSPIYEVQLWGL